MSYEAEKAVIGCLLLDASEKENISLTPDEFTDDLLGQIYFQFLVSDGQLDPILIKSRIRSDYYPEDVINGVLNDCISSVSTSVEISKYADIIHAEYKKKVIDTAYNSGKSMDEIMRVFESLDDNKKTHTIDSIIKEYAPKMFTPQTDKGFDTGFSDLDNDLNGLFRGDICIVAARPGVGKTAFALEIMLNLARAGVKTSMFSLEMTNKQLYERILARESGIVLNRITRAQSFVGNEPQIFEDANKSLSELKDYMEFHDDIYTLGDIRRYARGCDVIFVDYVQLVTPETSYKGNRYAEIGAISHEFRRMAKKLNVCVVLLAQLNRVSESLATKEPSMSELREGGDLEQDAAQVILLWNKTEDRKTKGIKIDKNRHGEPGATIEMQFDGAVNKFMQPLGDCPFV